MTGVIGNGQRQCWVHELTSLSIRALRVFAEQKLGMAFVHRHPWRGGTDAVQECASLHILELQVFHSKNSLLFYLPGVLGGNELFGYS